MNITPVSPPERFNSKRFDDLLAAAAPADTAASGGFKLREREQEQEQAVRMIDTEVP